MKLKKMALLILISGGFLFGICTGFAYAGALYICQTGTIRYRQRYHPGERLEGFEGSLSW